ncbi:MAG: adenylosuccinate lyase [Bacteroidota bacterium]|nr:adenylosuccinate lyase [Bacteroidota bacterium]
MQLNKLTAISPIDGRYRKKLEALSNYFSEFALIKYRVFVEIQYFIALWELEIPQLLKLSKNSVENIEQIFLGFSIEDAIYIKKIEEKINHDVKAVEYFIKDKFDELGLSKFKEFVHFGLTSQDINNTAIPLILKNFTTDYYLNKLFEVRNELQVLIEKCEGVSVLARTHGQPASPTKLDKEIKVFKVRIDEQIKILKNNLFASKFSGATGNFNAHKVSYPNVDWETFGRNFCEKKLKLHYSFPTTQIEHYDHYAALCDSKSRINTILIDLCRDMWSYISLDYFNQKINKNEVGSSAMPHKVNPIDFENAEGNLGLANSIFRHFSQKLPISRLQRDLTDSTVLRNAGVPISHSILSFESLIKGLKKLNVNKKKIHDDLNENWIVIAEAIQTILRREGYKNPYEKIKELTRNNKKITKNDLLVFINRLDVSEQIKEELKNISPKNYTGI